MRLDELIVILRNADTYSDIDNYGKGRHDFRT